MGAGAVGCYFGGMLARAGHEVTLVAPPPPHVEAIRRDGLLLDTVSFQERAQTEPSAVRGARGSDTCQSGLANAGQAPRQDDKARRLRYDRLVVRYSQIVSDSHLVYVDGPAREAGWLMWRKTGGR